MDHNFEKIPAVVFDWIETTSFVKLNAAQQNEVLAWFSEEEYNEMHQTAMGLRSTSFSENPLRSESRKQSVMEHFDKINPGKVVRLSPKFAVAWQAAAILLFLLSGWLFYQLFDLKNDLTMQQVASTDTVYVDKEVRSQPEIIRDTVYLYKQAVNKKTSLSRSSITNVVPEEQEVQNDTEILPAEDTALNDERKGNSMRDDSLLRRFSFYSL